MKKILAFALALAMILTCSRTDTDEFVIKRSSRAGNGTNAPEH